MFGNFGRFESDPFFSSHKDRLRAFDEFFSQDPFRRHGMLGLTDGENQDRRVEARNRPDDRAVAGRDHFRDPFGLPELFYGFDRSMRRIHEDFDRMATDDNCHAYSQSSVMSYSKGGDGKPNFFEATSSTRKGPGGIRETKKTVRDSEKELEKMALGHHIKERGHVIERSRNTKTGHQEEKQDFQNISEDEIDFFDREWREKAGAYKQRGAVRGVDEGKTPRQHERSRDQKAVKDKTASKY